MLTTPATHPQFFQGPPPPAASAAQGGPGRAAESEVPQLDTSLYHRTVFSMPLPGKRKQAEITVYFDKETLQTVYVNNGQALAVLCDEDATPVQNAHGVFVSRAKKSKDEKKKVF